MIDPSILDGLLDRTMRAMVNHDTAPRPMKMFTMLRPNHTMRMMTKNRWITEFLETRSLKIFHGR